MKSEKHTAIHKIQYQAMFKLWAVNRKTHKEGKLVRILARSTHPDSARPVVVEVGELVGERLDVYRQQPGGVLYQIVGGGVDGALVHGLQHKEEVVPKQNVVKIMQTLNTKEANLSGRPRTQPALRLKLAIGAEAGHVAQVLPPGGLLVKVAGIAGITG